MKGGYIYLASNPAMRGYTKIGMSQQWPEKRLAELYLTNVPLPFKLEYVAQVKDRRLVESFLHHTFENKRVVWVNPKTGRKSKREFFTIEPELAVELAKQHLGNPLKLKTYKAKRTVGTKRWRKAKAWGIALTFLAAMLVSGVVEYLWVLANRFM